MKKINFEKWNLFKQKTNKPSPPRPAYGKPSYGRGNPPRYNSSNTIYRYKYLKSFMIKTLITIVAILFLILFKYVNFKPTNKILEIIEHNVQYKVDIKEDSKRIYNNVEKIIDKSLDSIPVFNRDNTEKLMSPVSGTIYKSYIIDLDDNNENSGIDILVHDNSENPKAIIEGTVKSVEIKGSKGYFVTIEGNDMKIIYGYLSKSFVTKGEKVYMGDSIGTIGTNKDGLKYLRFEVYLNGKSVNPLDYIVID